MERERERERMRAHCQRSTSDDYPALISLAAARSMRERKSQTSLPSHLPFIALTSAKSFRWRSLHLGASFARYTKRCFSPSTPFALSTVRSITALQDF